MCSRVFDGLLAPPMEYVPRRVRHFVNAAAKGGFWEIPAPLAAPGNIGKAPCVLDGLGHLEGLYDVSAPEQLYAMPCVFKPSGWVQRRLTPKEWLSLRNVPVSLVDTLSGELAIRGSIGVSMPALVVGHIFRTLWGSLLGGGSARIDACAFPALEGGLPTSRAMPQRVQLATTVVDSHTVPTTVCRSDTIDEVRKEESGTINEVRQGEQERGTIDEFRQGGSVRSQPSGRTRRPRHIFSTFVNCTT